MAITLEEIMAKIPEERQQKILVRAEELKKEEQNFQVKKPLLRKKITLKISETKKLQKN